MNRRLISSATASLLFTTFACSPGRQDSSTSDSDTAFIPSATAPSSGPELGEPDTSSAQRWWPMRVKVLLDGQPGSLAVLKQGGVNQTFLCDAQGVADILVDLALEGEIVLHASHPDARIGYAHIDPAAPPAQLTMPLHRFDRSDNEDYPFWGPGTPDDLLNCAHCHHKMNATWFESPHRYSASNPTVQDLYAGTASAYATEQACVSAGGRWMQGRIPGTQDQGMRCYIGEGALPALNDNCGEEIPCDDVAQDFGACADCHAPGINGKIGGRNLLDAVGDAYEYGVHCDVCHKVESIHPGKAPGVAGYLKILRPSEPPTIPGELYEPLIFGPFHDVSQLQMGAVYRDFFRKADFCAGCHDYGVSVNPRAGAIDADQWKSGELPVQSTFNEWQQGPYATKTPCMECHMPADLQADNAAGLEDSIASGPSQIAGWIRPKGEIHKHTWIGPRTPSSGLLQRSAELGIDAQVLGDSLAVQVTVKNVGAGHALPTGLPTRSMILLVQAQCDGEALTAEGGDIVPDFGGAYAQRSEFQSWTKWPGAKVGQVIRVAKRTSTQFVADPLPRFGREKGPVAPLDGFPKLEWVGASMIQAVSPEGDLSFDRPLPSGDVAFLGDAFELRSPRPQRLAGLPGFAFARVTVDKAGKMNVPSFRAVDIRNDNRILPMGQWTSHHQFSLSCIAPKVQATLLYRSFPPDWVEQRDWDRPDVIVQRAQLELPGSMLRSL